MNIARTICLGFLSVIAIGTLLLLLPIATSSGDWNNPIVALFTATSAVCVTGLIVVDTGSYFSPIGQGIILLLIQIGGLGYMTTTTFLILLLGRRRLDLGQRVAIQEAFDRPFVQGSRSLLGSIALVTVAFEGLGFFLLLPLFDGRGDRIWQALFHSVSAWNNAGFSLLPDSLTIFRGSIWANIAIPILIIFGGLGYQTIIELYLWITNRVRPGRSRFVFSLNAKVAISTTLFLLISGTLVFSLTPLIQELSVGEKLIAAWFQSVSTRTAGFNTIDLGQMSEAALFLSIGLMFIGSSPSGTGGGIKTTTVRLLLVTTRSILQGKTEVILYERTVPLPTILKALAVLCGSVLAAILSIALLGRTDPQFRFIEIVFEAVSAYATVGLSTGITDQFSLLGQLVLIGTMYVGRVGILIFMSALLGAPRPSNIHYPSENLLVG